MNRIIKFTVIAKKWFDRVNGNTYHSVRCIRCRDNAVVVGTFQYGCGESYKQTALYLMAKVGWLIKSYSYTEYTNRKAENKKPFTIKVYIPENAWEYERENNYPILWTVSKGLKKDCIANGKL